MNGGGRVGTGAVCGTLGSGDNGSSSNKLTFLRAGESSVKSMISGSSASMSMGTSRSEPLGLTGGEAGCRAGAGDGLERTITSSSLSLSSMISGDS